MFLAHFVGDFLLDRVQSRAAVSMPQNEGGCVQGRVPKLLMRVWRERCESQGSSGRQLVLKSVWMNTMGFGFVNPRLDE